MARISGYNNDSELTGNDLLVGSSYEGLQNGSPKYITRTYKLSDLASYFGGFVNDVDLNDLLNRVGDLENTVGSGGDNGDLISRIEDLEDGVSLISTTVTDNTSALATAQQSITAITTEVQAQATFKTNLAATFGTFDENGNLTSLSQAFADQVLQTTASDRYAKASFVTNLASSVGTYDQDGNLVTLSSGFVDQVISTVSTDIESVSTFSTNLASSFGTYNPDGTISSFSSAFADQVFTATASDRFAEATYVNNLGASIGQLNPDGTLVFDINSSYSQGIKTYIENNSAIAESVETLQAIYTTLPVTIRQPDEPPTLDVFNDLAYPLGSIWVDTDDSNALYVLIEDAGSPTGYSWSPTTSEALGDLILSNSQLQQEVNILSTNVSTEATKLDTLRSKFGYFDINTGEFIVENTAEIISNLRTYADSQSAAAVKAEEVRAQVNDGPTSIIAQVDETTTAIASKPNVYRQDEEPTGTIPVKSVWYDTNDDNKPYVYESGGWVEARDGKVTELQEYALAQKTLEADANGVVTGITIKSVNSGDAAPPISNITFKTNTFNIVDQSDTTRLSFDGQTGNLNITGTLSSGSVISGATVTGTLSAGQVSIVQDQINIGSNGDINFANGGSISSTVYAGGNAIGITTNTFVVNGDSFTSGAIFGGSSLGVAGALSAASGLFGGLVNGSIISASTQMTAPDFVLSSDVVLKENIKEYKQKPINIQYKTYNLIGDENKRVGVIAQELEKEHPEFIRENEDGIKSVSYIDMLVAKVAELEARIKELEHGVTK